MNSILIVEDDTALSGGLSRALGSDAATTCCASLKDAALAISRESFSLILLDVNLPDGSGFDFLRRLKEQIDTPVILLTANDMETDIVAGLEAGAEDYITKPFSLAVLRARVNNVLRRSETKGAGPVVVIDDYRFDFERMEFTRRGEPVELSKAEQKLLRALVENRGVTVTRRQLLDYIWSYGSEYVDENALSVTVKRLRDKLEETPSKPRYIQTVYGIGYVWRAEA